MTAVWVVVLVTLVGLAYYGMWHGWRNRARRHDLPEPRFPELGRLALPDPIVAAYVSTTTAGNWLDRVTAHGLGTISQASLAVHDGALIVLREGARDLWIPADALVSVRRERGIAGKVRNPGGIVVVTWRLGEYELDTGLRPRRPADAEAIEDAVHLLIEGANHG